MPCNVLTVYAAVRSHVKDNYWYRMADSAAAAYSHPACCEAPGGKDDVWAFGSPGVGFGLLGVWGTQRHHPGGQGHRCYVLLDASGCTHVDSWKKEMGRGWCNRFEYSYTMSYSIYLNLVIWFNSHIVELRIICKPP